MKNTNKLLEFIKSNNIFEFEIVKYSSSKLTIIGDFDLCYHHYMEIYAMGLRYLSCPMHFRASNVRLASEREKKDIRSNFVDTTSTISLCFEKFDVKYFIVADSFEYIYGNVYHYKREDLKEGERIAEWVKDDNEE